MHDNDTDVVIALDKAYRNPVMARRIVELFKECKFKLKEDENPYAKETATLNITERDARILSTYYEFCDEKDKLEAIEYKKKYPYPSSFFDGIKPYLPEMSA